MILITDIGVYIVWRMTQDKNEKKSNTNKLWIDYGGEMCRQ